MSSGLFGSRPAAPAPAPKPAKPPVMPDPQSPEVLEAQRRTVADLAMGGRAGTVLTRAAAPQTLAGSYSAPKLGSGA